MSRFSRLVGSVAILALSGVNAGPCRPPTSVVTSLESAITSTEIAESTTTLAATSSVQSDVTETLAVTLSTVETAITSAETTDIASTTAPELTITIEVPTTTEAPTTTAEATTTAIATTSAVPDPFPAGTCPSLSNPYTAPNGVRFEPRCASDFDASSTNGVDQAASFEDCLSLCAENIGCKGVQYLAFLTLCVSVSSGTGYHDFGSIDIALKLEE